MTIYVATALVYLAYLVAIWFLGSFLGLQGNDLWILRGGLALIGLVAGGVILWFHFKAAKQKAAAEGASGVPKDQGSEIDAVIREAENRLKSSNLGRSANLRKLPVVLIVGDLGTGKTSSIVHSGLEAELLSGQVYEGNNGIPMPTRSANLWFAKNTTFLEANSKVIANSGLWSRLMSRLLPGKIGALKGGHPPRAAVVCVSCETFTQLAGSRATGQGSPAGQIRTSLEEVARILGIRFPVYVLFTKADRIPFFAEFTRNFSNDEAAQVLGATLPLRPSQEIGVYAEQETQRLNATFNNLVLSVADNRTGLLAREHDTQKLGGIYEFPRELRKLQSPVIQFLVDICRPSQLRATPFLRGFYFSGVRPVFVNEVAQPAAPEQPAKRTPFHLQTEATQLFKAERPTAQAAAGQPQVVGVRKAPQWTFLTHFFSHVLLQDRLALAAASSSVKTNSLRRVLLAAGATACILLSIAFVISYWSNRTLKTEITEASTGASGGGSPSSGAQLTSALAKLDALRQSLEKLSTYRREGAPLHLRWGLYVGDDLRVPVRKLYFKQFHALLFGSTQTAIADFLRGLPATPGGGDDYGLAYDTLKAYLITTSNHDKSSGMFLAPVLLKRWSAERNPDAETLALAQKQFDFFSEELKDENPFSSENDAVIVARARRYLSQFAGAERVYQFMLTEASRKHPPANFNRQYPGSVDVVVDPREVASAYTKEGWTFMQDAIKNADRFFSGESWVLGEQGTAGIDRGKLEQQLKDRYTADFVDQWQQFLRAAAVARYASVKDAATKLNRIAGNQSPLFQLFCMVSRNTGVEAPPIKTAFQSVHSVAAPTCGDQQLNSESSGEYMKSLVPLAALLEQIGNSSGSPSPALVDQAMASALQAKVITRQLAQKFQPDLQNHSEEIVQRLMEAPISAAEGLIRNMGPADLNAKGRAFCSQFSDLAGKYPFNSSMTRQTTLQEMNSVFRPPQGAFWTFYETNLRNVLDRRGGQFVVKEGSPITINPAFLNFWNRTASFVDVVYPDNSPQPKVTFTLKPYKVDGVEASLTIDGQTISTSGSSAPQSFVWTGNPVSTVKLSATIRPGGALPPATYDGTWALFQFVGDASKSTPIATGFRYEWDLVQSLGRSGRAPTSGSQAAIRFDLEGKGAAILQKNPLGSCVSEIAR